MLILYSLTNDSHQFEYSRNHSGVLQLRCENNFYQCLIPNTQLHTWLILCKKEWTKYPTTHLTKISWVEFERDNIISIFGVDYCCSIKEKYFLEVVMLHETVLIAVIYAQHNSSGACDSVKTNSSHSGTFYWCQIADFCHTGYDPRMSTTGSESRSSVQDTSEEWLSRIACAANQRTQKNILVCGLTDFY